MGSVSTYRNLANCSLLLAISLIFASVSAIPSPRWRCKPLQFPASNLFVYRYAGRASLSQAREVCRGLGTVPVVDNSPGECLQEYYGHINNSQGYAVVKNGLLTCFSPCQSNWCSGNCQDDNNVTIVCLTDLDVPARSIDFSECTQLTAPALGAVDYPNGRRFWAYARFRCAPGSVLNNSLGVFCEHDGQWRSFTGPEPSAGVTSNVERTCTKVCPNIQMHLNGIIRKPSAPFTQPKVKCFDGWTLKGQPSINCQSSVKRWEISGGSCLRTCPPTKHIVNGFLLINDTSSGSMAIVACKDGFTFHGNFSVRCAANGQWSPVNGSCKANCQWAKTISRGFLHITTNEIGSTAVAVCSANHKFEGDPNVTCGRDGKWADVNGSCQAICQSVEHVNNGVVVVIDDAVNSTAEIRCFQKFISVGDPTVRCQENGTWSSFNGSCEAVCPFVEHVNNGVVFVTDNTVNSTEEIKCFQNFTLVGDPTVRCQANGAWSSFNGTCEANCPREAAIQDGFLNITDNVKGATATVVCLDGFTYVGPEEVWCTEFGTWPEVNGSCQVDSVIGSGGDSTTVGDTTRTVTTSSWLGAIPSQVVIALAVFFLCLLLILMVVLVTCTRRARHYGVTDRSSSDESEAKASTAEKHRPLVSSTECENDTYDVLGAPATATFDQPPNDVNDHLGATSKVTGPTQSGHGEPADNQPKLCESETRLGEYASITHHDLETKSQDRQPVARAAIQDAYTMVDLKTKKPRSDQEQTTEELTDAMDEINDLMGDPILPPRLEASL